MKFFLDTADVSEIREGVAMGLVDGVTTNPSLVAKTGRPFRKVIEEICGLVPGPVSAETVSEDAAGMLAEARELAAIAPQVTVKIPMTLEGLKATKACTQAGIKTNVTLVFQPLQGLLAAKAGATFVSPFVGRLDDVGTPGMDMVADLKEMLDNYGYPTEIIVASIRHTIHVHQAAMLGAHICTVPLKILRGLVQHPLTDSGIRKFLEDSKKIPKG
ncbi:MAG TPA: fructose-6-phosphate aldolase [Myxococcota bacterium]|nr:fructose-6-phosphate aldolase [Myxococcota bacterium]HRY96744.1 fructose-6-phosphate aldolase [Myxococcota bacterium]HSA23872.1 fructose-6-phosphate aldolase [Myxococcota bacterium]